jgi:hypothetical protein
MEINLIAELLDSPAETLHRNGLAQRLRSEKAEQVPGNWKGEQDLSA